MGIIRKQAHRWVVGLCLLGCWFGTSVHPQEPLLPNLIDVIVCDTGYTFFGKTILPMGDQNGDGYSDFITNDYRGTYLYYGAAQVSQTWSKRIDSLYLQLDNVGDINGDGYLDLMARGKSPTYPKLGLFYGGPNMGDVPDFRFGNDTLYGTMNAVYSNDLDGDGIPEIVSQVWDHANLVVFRLFDPLDSVPDLKIHPANKKQSGYDYDYSAFGEGLIVGDFNGDGNTDLAANYRPRSDSDFVGEVWLYWGGEQFDTIPNLIIKRPQASPYHGSFVYFGRTLVNLGDFNGDKYCDFFAASGEGSGTEFGYVYFGGPAIDTIPDLILPLYITVAASSSDINGDSYNDLLTSTPSPPLSALGYINVFFGGPNADSIPDFYIHNDDLEFFQTEFGMDIAGLGDINGDGINDWAFSLVDRMERGNIYLMSGTGTPTEVEDEVNGLLPDQTSLHQNYPNPFNPSTTIEFELPVGQHVKLEVFNVLGQNVETLVDQFLPAGVHKVVWDAQVKRNLESPNYRSSDQLPTGVYLYRLKGDHIDDTKKMVLSK